MNIDTSSLFATESILTLVIAICAASAVTLAGFWFYKRYILKQEEEEFESDFNEIFSSEFEEETGDAPKSGLTEKWNKYWKDKTKRAGVTKYAELDSSMPGRDAVIFALIAGALTGIFSLNIAFGFIGFLVAPVIYTMFLGMRINQVEASLNSQVPPFLAAFKANIQANETAERALIRVIDDIGDPLYSELLPVKRKIQSGTDISDALDDLKERTTSYELRFLCSCIKLASAYGADLEKQIDTIQGVITERQKVTDKLSSAARSARPAMIMGTLIIPIMFFAIYMFYDQAREFWFVDPISWIALLLIGVIYGIGMWITKAMVDNLKKM